mgnify:CR=1 FL=1
MVEFMFDMSKLLGSIILFVLLAKIFMVVVGTNLRRDVTDDVDVELKMIDLMFKNGFTQKQIETAITNYKKATEKIIYMTQKRKE